MPCPLDAKIAVRQAIVETAPCFDFMLVRLASLGFFIFRGADSLYRGRQFDPTLFFRAAAYFLGYPTPDLERTLVS
jgi:hypothetical protein